MKWEDLHKIIIIRTHPGLLVAGQVATGHPSNNNNVVKVTHYTDSLLLFPVKKMIAQSVSDQTNQLQSV